MSNLVTANSLRRNGKIAVIGSGISGLSFAYFLSKLRPDLYIKIFEKSHRTGGYIDTAFTSDGQKFERGPRTLRGASDGTLVILDLLLKFGLKEEIYAVYKKSQGNKKYLLAGLKNSEDDYLVEVPENGGGGSLLKFFMSPLSKRLILGAMMEPFQKLKRTGEDESIGSFIGRRFGSPVNDNIASAMIHGIYGGDSNKLSVKALMPRLFGLEQSSSIVISGVKAMYKNRNQGKTEKKTEISEDLISYEANLGKPMIPFQNFKKYLSNFPMILFKDKGLSLLTDSLRAQLLKSPRVELVFDQETLKIGKNDDGEGVMVNDEIFDHIRSTVKTTELASMLDDSAIKNKLAELPYVDMIVVNVFIKDTKLFKEGFGYLVPQSVSPQKHYLLGCIFDSSIEKNSIQLLSNNRHLVKLINYPNLKQEEINGMIKLKETSADETQVKLTMMFGGHYIKRHPEIWSQSERQFKKIVSDLLQEQFHLTPNPNDIIVNRIENCIPQYEVGYLEYKEEVLQALKDLYGDKLSVGGMSFNTYNGVGVPDCVMDSFKKAVDLK